jgi:propionyl-CoA synthetase
VIVYMPMIAEALFAVLACVRLGAIHSVVFGGFAAYNWRCGLTTPSPS